MTTSEELRRTARRRGIETRWRDTKKVWNDVSDDTLRALLEVLGPEPEPAPVPPIVVTADGRSAAIDVSGTAGDVAVAVDERSHVTGADATIAVAVAGDRITLTGLPVGRHLLDVGFADGSSARCTVIVAPPQSLASPRGSSSVFVPTYALHRPARGHGAGDLADLDALAAGLAGHGVDVVTILPIHPMFCGDRPFDPSPYSPVTRLHWSELVADLSGLPGPDGSPAFDDAARRRAAELAAAPLIDWRGVAGLVHDVLDRALSVPAIAADVAAFAAAEPDVVDYARFRAHVARTGAPPAHDTCLDQDIADPAVGRHVLGQLVVRRQLDELGETLGRRGQLLALDLPVGSHPAGHEAWQRHRSFALGAAVGAPPDDFFVGGQNWGFPPLHPEHARADGHQVWHDVIDAVARRCGLLRIDHVMALHRLWWIPDGAAATDGAYVRFRPDELWATVATTSVLRDTIVVGEDLGTVPDEVTEARRSWAVLGMYEEQFTADRPEPDELPEVPDDVVAGVRTHDMMPFAAFATGSDIELRASLGIAAPDGSGALDRATRLSAWRRLLADELGHAVDDDPVALLAAALERLGVSDAAIVVADIDDLTGIVMPHNVPGVPSYPGAWSRRTARDVEGLLADPQMTELLGVLAEARRR
ncbi:MAG: 4-alpha-glucanotransferase [Acidimicrobiales bacterium]